MNPEDREEIGPGLVLKSEVDTPTNMRKDRKTVDIQADMNKGPDQRNVTDMKIDTRRDRVPLCRERQSLTVRDTEKNNMIMD